MCPAQRRVEAQGPWRLEWDGEFVRLQAFGVDIAIEPSQNDPQLVLVDVDKTNPATSETAVQIYQDHDLCREF